MERLTGGGDNGEGEKIGVIVNVISVTQGLEFISSHVK